MRNLEGQTQEAVPRPPVSAKKQIDRLVAMIKAKKVLAGITAALCSAQILTAAAAPSVSEIKSQKEDADESLGSLMDSIEDLENQKEEIENEIDTLDGQLVTAMSAVNSLNQQIEEKEKELENTRGSLETAEKEKDQQYKAMQTRIQYIYEHGGNAGWMMILLESGDLSKLLNRVEYTQQMYEYDRECLEEYADTVSQIHELEEKQAEDIGSLQAMKDEQESQQKYLEEKLEEKRNTSSDYETQMQEARQKAEDYQKLSEEYNKQIQELARTQQSGKSSADAEEAKRIFETLLEENWTEEERESDEFKKGRELVEYALQFVGNPYVWGGGSLTEGTDCSGFIHLIYKHFNYSVDRQSAALRDEGRAVSYAEAQPGDIICYSGHVALYMGGGTIVHAANENAGIIVGSATFAPILSIRRVV